MDSATVLTWSAVGIAVVAAMLLWVIFAKGRPVPGPHVFRASRLSRGNRLFPTQVAVTPTSVVQYTPRWIGRLEHSIHMAHIASVEVDTNLFFADVLIETSGGSDPVRCYGHKKQDALEMKRLIEQFQSDYYKGQGSPRVS